MNSKRRMELAQQISSMVLGLRTKSSTPRAPTAKQTHHTDSERSYDPATGRCEKYYPLGSQC